MLRRLVRAGHHAPRLSKRASSSVAFDSREYQNMRELYIEERVRRSRCRKKMFQEFQNQSTRATTTSQVRYTSSDVSAPDTSPSTRQTPVKVAVTGPAGQIAYSLLFRLASGQMFGPNQRVQINAIECPMSHSFPYTRMKMLGGVAMELEDCGFPLLDGIVCTDDLAEGFDDADLVLLVGAKPRGPRMERGDMIKHDGEIYQTYGQMLNKYAKRDVKVTVFGAGPTNPANTNALIAAYNAPDIPMSNFTAMTRLDHDRGLSQLARKARCTVNDIENFVIWGNHSPTMYPDISNCKIHGESAKTYLQAVNPGVNIDEWYTDTFIPIVRQRATTIIHERGSTSAASAANAALAHCRDWSAGSDGKVVSMAFNSSTDTACYGIAPGIIYSYPVVCKDGNYSTAQDWPIDEFSHSMMKAAEKELLDERDVVSHLLLQKA